MRTKSLEMVTINITQLEEDIKKLEGDRFAGTRIAEFIMGMDKTYWTSMKKDNRCNTKAFNKVCSYYGLNPADYIGVPDVVEPPTPTVSLDAIVVSLGNLAELQKDQGDTMKQLLQEIKVLNTKLARLENLMGQMHTNIIQVKDNTGEAVKTQKESGSTLATISGRTKDLLESLS